MTKALTTVLLALILTHTLTAQDSISQLVFSGYVEVFYGLDANRPQAEDRVGFLYSHNRNNEFNLNLGYLKAAYTTPRTRANLAVGVGTYMADNYAGEPAGARNLFEANVGVRLNAKSWLDLGILPSHIGSESAISRDCWTLSRSLMAENSPYFETGARITHAPNEKWQLSALILNGWQRIARAQHAPAYGTQMIWKPREGVLLNWSTYAGHANRLNDNRWRIFQNLYATMPLSDRLMVLGGLDFGTERSDRWYSAITTLRYTISKQWTMAARYEQYTDREAVLIGLQDFRVSGGSCNLDFAVTPETLIRCELRYLHSDQEVFVGKRGTKQNRFAGLISVASGF